MTTRMAVLTGGPGAGKTTLIEALGARGYPVVPEAAMMVIEAAIAETGSPDAYRAWRAANLAEFQLRIAREQTRLEREARASGAPVVFCDRGLVDGLAYMERGGEPVPDELQALVDAASYDVVFVLSTLSNFDVRADTGRTSTQTDSIELSDRLREAYSDRGLRVVDVPEAPVEARLAQVLEALGG